MVMRALLLVEEPDGSVRRYVATVESATVTPGRREAWPDAGPGFAIEARVGRATVTDYPRTLDDALHDTAGRRPGRFIARDGTAEE